MKIKTIYEGVEGLVDASSFLLSLQISGCVVKDGGSRPLVRVVLHESPRTTARTYPREI